MFHTSKLPKPWDGAYSIPRRGLFLPMLANACILVNVNQKIIQERTYNSKHVAEEFLQKTVFKRSILHKTIIFHVSPS